MSAVILPRPSWNPDDRAARHRVRRLVQCSLMPTKHRRTLVGYVRTHIGLLSFVVLVAISAVLLAGLVFN